MAIDFFLKLDGIQGESVVTGHENEIGIHSFSWGASQTTSVSSGAGSSSGRAHMGDFTIMKNLDKATPKLFQALCKGSHIANATFTGAKSVGDAAPKTFLTFTFTQLFVTSLQNSASTEIPAESVSFSYGTVKFEYLAQKSDGTLVSTGAVSYDVQKNQVS